MKIRIRFSKMGTMRFISHLDVMRYFQKVMRRAKVDILYSQGFSPHQIMSFASPLGIGQTSEGEYVDIEVGQTGSSSQMVERLNQEMADGFQIISFRRLPDTGKTNAMATISAADYRVRLHPEDLLNRRDYGTIWDAFLHQDSILVCRKTKSREEEINIRPMIREARWQEDGSFFLRLDAGSARNLKPETVWEGFLRYSEANAFLPPELLSLGGGSLPSRLRIHRLDLYGEKEGMLTSLEEFGEEIL